MSPRGGARPGSGRPARAGAPARDRETVWLAPAERALLRPAPDGILRPGETPAGFLRKYGMAEAARRVKRKGK